MRELKRELISKRNQNIRTAYWITGESNLKSETTEPGHYRIYDKRRVIVNDDGMWRFQNGTSD